MNTTIPNLSPEVIKQIEEDQKAMTFKHRKEDLQWVMETAEERARYYRANRHGRAEQVEEADRYIKQYEALRNEAEIKLLRLVLNQ